MGTVERTMIAAGDGGETAGASPPRPHFTLNIGVTGHRRNRLTVAHLAHASGRLADVMRQLGESAARLQGVAAAYFAGPPPDVRLVCALAEGADRLAADAALGAGFALDVILPFDRETYAEDFDTAESHEDYARLLAIASAILELPGERGQDETAYAVAGAAILAVTDVLVAVWNGEESAGRGGTGDVVASALAQGKPVIHVPIGAHEPIRLLWPGDGPAAGSWAAALEPPARPFSAEAIDQVLAARLLPPDDPAERAALATFFAEREQQHVRRIEYPLLLALIGADGWSKVSHRKPPYAQANRPYWAAFDAAMAGWVAPQRYQALEDRYSWADHLANRFAQFFRSGHVINFVFSAIAIALALIGLLVPSVIKVGLVIVELLLIGVIVINTRVGQREAWQQRWLDYRQLAERLRPMRSLKLLAVAQPPDVSAASRTGNQRWIDWYAGAAWRELALPSGVLTPARLAVLKALVRDGELAPEIQYHRSNARKMHHVHHWLHRFGSACFLLTVMLCLGFLLTTALLDATTANHVAVLFSVATAALPAFGSAAYGLRVQGDFEGSAARSGETAAALVELTDQLEQAASLTRTAAVANAAAAVMLVDLAEWRLTYQQRQLEIPG